MHKRKVHSKSKSSNDGIFNRLHNDISERVQRQLSPFALQLDTENARRCQRMCTYIVLFGLLCILISIPLNMAAKSLETNSEVIVESPEQSWIDAHKDEPVHAEASVATDTDLDGQTDAEEPADEDDSTSFGLYDESADVESDDAAAAAAADNDEAETQNAADLFGDKAAVPDAEGRIRLDDDDNEADASHVPVFGNDEDLFVPSTASFSNASIDSLPLCTLPTRTWSADALYDGQWYPDSAIGKHLADHSSIFYKECTCKASATGNHTKWCASYMPSNPRYEPKQCRLQRFSAQDWKGRWLSRGPIYFIGDYMSLQQYEALKCSLMSRSYQEDHHQTRLYGEVVSPLSSEYVEQNVRYIATMFLMAPDRPYGEWTHEGVETAAQRQNLTAAQFVLQQEHWFDEVKRSNPPPSLIVFNTGQMLSDGARGFFASIMKRFVQFAVPALRKVMPNTRLVWRETSIPKCSRQWRWSHGGKGGGGKHGGGGGGGGGGGAAASADGGEQEHWRDFPRQNALARQVFGNLTLSVTRRFDDVLYLPIADLTVQRADLHVEAMAKPLDTHGDDCVRFCNCVVGSMPMLWNTLMANSLVIEK